MERGGPELDVFTFFQKADGTPVLCKANSERESHDNDQRDTRL